jgi:hypothetical protein
VFFNLESTFMTKLLASFVISAIYVSVVLAEEPQSPLKSRIIKINPGGGFLEIIDGTPKFRSAISADTAWTLFKADKGWAIQTWTGNPPQKVRYLAVDKEGKVELVAELDEGAYWKLNLNHIGRMLDDGEIQVSGGKFDGWFLGRSDKAQELNYTLPSGGTWKEKIYDPELSEKSGERTKFRIDVDGP